MNEKQKQKSAQNNKIENNDRSDKYRDPIVLPQKWFGKIVDSPVRETHVYKAQDQVLVASSTDRVIESSGVFELGRSSNGISKIRFVLNFLNPKESEEIFAQLLNEIPWQQMNDKVDGVEYQQPRFAAWFGELPYSYSGITWQPNSMSSIVKRLRAKLEEMTGLHFNSVLANLYRDGNDNVSWHADDEPELGPQPTIASVSFGETRRFCFRKKENESEVVCVPLSAGSLVIMDEATQNDWQHCVPQETYECGPRINLTYRIIYPHGQQPELL